MPNFKSTLFSGLKGIVVALLFSVVAVLIFAFLLSAFNITSSVIKPVNVFIKIVSVFLGVLVSVRGEKGLLKGAILGAIIIALSLLLFRIIGGEQTVSSGIIWELLLGTALGAIAGIFSVNLKK